MLRTKSAASLIIGIAAFALAGPLAMPGHASVTHPDSAAVSPIIPPVLPPRCQHLAPEGAVFIGRVQPVAGPGWEVYRLPSGQTVNIYCI